MVMCRLSKRLAIAQRNVPQFTEESAMKRLIVCCDGTWQTSEQPYPTNVAKLNQAIKREDTEVVQLVHYENGIGSRGNIFDRTFGGAFGWGIDEHIQRAYQFLCSNYTEGDEIYLFGFSRGAYTVRSLAGLIRVAQGLLPSYQPNLTQAVRAVYEVYRSEKNYPGLSVEEANEREVRRKEAAIRAISPDIRPVKIAVLGCWDTVGALGVPNTIPLISNIANQKYRFHDCQLSNIIERALHAVAIDEQRQAFSVTPMQQSDQNVIKGQVLKEVWFVGDHGAIGGGSKDLKTLSDWTLFWLIDTIRNTWNLGLEFDLSHVESDLETSNPAQQYGLHPNALLPNPLPDDIPLLFRLTGIKSREIPEDAELHPSVFERWQKIPDYRPFEKPESLVAQLNGKTVSNVETTTA